MPKGNEGNPFGAGSINAFDSDLDVSGEHQRGPRYGANDCGSINAKANAKKWDRESKLGKVETVLDKPLIASDKRAQAATSDEYYPNRWYGTPPWRQK